MNVLLLSSRFPWPAYTGDRLRATIWLSALDRDANVTLVSPPGTIPAHAPRFRFEPARPSPRHAIAASLRVLRGLPASALLAAPYDWRGAIERAGDFDAAIVLLSRLDPWVRDFLPNGLRILDAIDSLGRSMDERARQSAPPLRWLWQMESRRVARAEADAARAYDHVLVVNADESAELGADVVGLGVPIAPLGDAPRTFDFGFWGRLPYFANRDAVRWLLDEIWPAIRAQRPNATLAIGGADAPAWIRAAHGRDGITVVSPFDDVATFARRIQVALFPVRYGTGQLTKVLEAAEAGCAIVATSHALRGLDALRPHATIANDTLAFARAAFVDHASGKALRAAVEASHSRAQTLDRLATIIRKTEAAA